MRRIPARSPRWLLACLSLGGMLACGCGYEAVESPAASVISSEAEQADVRVVEATLRPWPRIVRAQGSLIEDEYALLGAKVAGRVKNVLVDVGTSVEAGQPVAELDTADFELMVQQAEAQVLQARAAIGLKPGVPDDQIDPLKAPPVLQEWAVLEEARMNVDRVKGLAGRGVLTQEEIQARESALRVAEARYASSLNMVQVQIAALKLRRAELAMALQHLEDAVLKAPFVGIIQETHVAPGSYVTVGQPVVALVRVDPLRFRAGIPERSAVGVDVGQPITLKLEGQLQPIQARISRISPALDITSRSLIIEADLENSDGKLRTGLFAEAEILVDADQQTLAVPASSIISFGGVEKVWTVVDGKAAPRQIRTGRRDNKLVEVLSGLEPGEFVVSNGDEGREGLVRAVHDDPDSPGGDRAALIGG
jgi:RND family efflux transporter MFP subunit